MAQFFQLAGHGAVGHYEVGLPAALDAVADDAPGVMVGPDHDGRAVELFGLVQGGALRDEEAEAAVRFAAYPEQGDLLTGFAAEIHDRADFAVGVYAYLGTGILPGQVAGCHAAGGCRR